MRIKRKRREDATPVIIGTIKKLGSYEDLRVFGNHKENVPNLPESKTTNGHSNHENLPNNNNNYETTVYTISNSIYDQMSPIGFQNESETSETVFNEKTPENKPLRNTLSPPPPLSTTTTEKYRTRKEYRKLLRKVNDKPKWMSAFNFQACSLALLCGLGTSWRFSAVAIQNHGGTFTFAYIITWLLIGVPVLLLEQMIGQFSNRGPWKVWCIVPLFKGVGLTQCILSFYFMLIFLTITAWSGIYFSMSCTSESLPWMIQCSKDTFSFDVDNSSIECAQHFFKSEVLHMTDLNEISGLDWKLLLVTVVALVLVTIICSFGLHLLQFAAPLLILLEILVFILLLVQASSQDNMVSSVRYFFEPQWEKLLKSHVWYSALTQVIFTQNIGSGIHITLSSYNSFRWSIAKMAIVTSFFSMVFGLLTGVTTFGMLGVMTDDIQNTTHLGYGLLFVTTSNAVGKLYGSCPQVWSAVIFAVFFLVGCTSIAGYVFNLTTVFCGWIPHLYKSPLRVVVPNTILIFLVGLLFTTGGGIYFVEILDSYGISVTALVCIFFETIGFLWIYGFSRFNRDIKMIAHSSKPIVWLAKIAFITPLLIMAVGIAALVQFTQMRLSDETLPMWTDIFGGILVTVALIPIPITMTYVVSTQIEFGFLGKFRLSVSPTMDWGPHQSHYRHAWLTAKINGDSEIATTSSQDVVLQKQEKFLSSPFNSRSN